ncbi:MAG: glycosyltransferase family 4 protein [Deltaproteobacteria bacterium]|nr:glycosyltransferase family 4 protein [Deltaproteobacteria bacterium]
MRLAVVVQRYGAGILGGAETCAAVLAGLLGRFHDVEVLTTTAREYVTWRNELPAGASEEAGVRVRRFPVECGREPAWGVLNRLLHDGFDSSAFALLPEAVREGHARRLRSWPDALQEAFVRGQGPHAPALHEHLRRTPYDRVVFVTYLYPTTYDGIAAVPPGRALVVPTLHDEPPAYLPMFGRRLARARLLGLTDTEVALMTRLYPGRPLAAERIGYGIELPPDVAARRASGDDFLLYAGRIDVQKGILQLLAWYRALRQAMAGAPRLVLIGQVAMPVPSQEGLEVRGFVDDAEKLRLMRDALALVHLSPYESLGIVLLEAMAVRTPVLVHADSAVMVEHCRRSGAGLWLREAGELVGAVRRLRSVPQLRERLGERGRHYVEREFSLPAFERRLREILPP